LNIVISENIDKDLTKEVRYIFSQTDVNIAGNEQTTIKHWTEVMQGLTDWRYLSFVLTSRKCMLFEKFSSNKLFDTFQQNYYLFCNIEKAYTVISKRISSIILQNSPWNISSKAKLYSIQKYTKKIKN
jgi:hypothetical protein